MCQTDVKQCGSAKCGGGCLREKNALESESPESVDVVIGNSRIKQLVAIRNDYSALSALREDRHA